VRVSKTEEAWRLRFGDVDRLLVLSIRHIVAFACQGVSCETGCLTTSASAPCCTNRSRRALRLLLMLNGAESEMAVLAVAPGKELAVLGHGA